MRCLNWWVVIVFLSVAIVLGLGIHTGAQQRPYTAYAVDGGCLYITAQGFATLREIEATQAELVEQKLCK